MGLDWAPGPPSVTSRRTSDLDEARALCGNYFGRRTLQLLDPSARLAARFDIMRSGALTIGDVEYGAEITGRNELVAYHANVPVSGGYLACQGRRRVHASSAVASVYRPAGVRLERASADCRILAVQIDKRALESHLESLLDVTVRGPLRLPIELDLTREPGRGWARMVRILADDITDPDGMLHHPIAAAPLHEGLLNATLLAMDHQYRDALERSMTVGNPGWCAVAVNAAVDAIEANPQAPFTDAVLAQIAGVGVTALRRAFRRRHGTSPMSYLWRTRLARVHDELLAADPRDTTVRDVARRWGFVHLGRFSAWYRACYRVSPTQTLRGPGWRTAQ